MNTDTIQQLLGSTFEHVTRTTWEGETFERKSFGEVIRVVVNTDDNRVDVYEFTSNMSLVSSTGFNGPINVHTFTRVVAFIRAI